jgi:hypothetical protein
VKEAEARVGVKHHKGGARGTARVPSAIGRNRAQLGSPTEINPFLLTMAPHPQMAAVPGWFQTNECCAIGKVSVINEHLSRGAAEAAGPGHGGGIIEMRTPAIAGHFCVAGRRGDLMMTSSASKTSSIQRQFLRSINYFLRQILPAHISAPPARITTIFMVHHNFSCGTKREHLLQFV